MSDSKIEYHRYFLRSRDRAQLNSRTERTEFEGALIRVDEVGVGCIHPWPELGDSTLEEELAALAGGNPLPLATCALQCAAVRGEARREGRWLFEDLPIPASHWTAGPNDDPQVIADDGFDAVKLKVGRDIDTGLDLIERWAGPEKIDRLRLDFNESLDPDLFGEFWQLLPVATQSKIEFIEDPFPYDFDRWTEIGAQMGVALALDRQACEFGLGWTDTVVLKPATVPSPRLAELVAEKSRDLVFTSYMDHAIGQCWAAYTAANCRPNVSRLAGLLTQERFESDDFFSVLGRDGSELRPPRGTGLGFDEQLEALLWKPLS